MPLFALTIMFSFTRTPKWARRTRKAASRSASSSSSGARSTARASSRSSGSPARALSARADQDGVTASSDMRFLLDQVEFQSGKSLRGDLARQPRDTGKHGHIGERLDQLGVRVLAGVRSTAVAVQDDAGNRQAAAPSLDDGEESVVHGAKAGAGDDEDWERELGGEIGDRPVRTDRDEQPAYALDDRHLVPLGELDDACQDLVQVERRSLEPRGDEGRQRRREGERRDLVELLLEARPGLEGRRIAVPGLDGLHDADVDAARAERARDRRRDDRLADTRVRPGHEESPHGTILPCNRLLQGSGKGAWFGVMPQSPRPRRGRGSWSSPPVPPRTWQVAAAT